MNNIPGPTLSSRCACHPEKGGLFSGLSRRSFLGTAAATLGTLAGCGTASPPPARAGTPYRIDVHHHLSPPSWVSALKARNAADPLVTGWTPRKSLDDMDAAGIATSVLSITTPGIFFPGADLEAGRRLARECNEYAAGLVRDHPGRFGFFAALPMLDVEGSLREAAHALDVLKADGIGLITSYGDKWLGDPMFFPVMDELNRRKATVYTHPTAANCCANLVPEIPPVMIEFGTDTTRAIASVLFNGTARRYRDIRWIFSHAGGTMPFLIERFVRHPILVPKVASEVPDGVAAELRRFHYDTAQTANPAAMSALTKVAPISQIVLGTDYPYRTSVSQVNGLREVGLFSEADLRAIEHDNPLRLLPRLRTT